LRGPRRCPAHEPSLAHPPPITRRARTPDVSCTGSRPHWRRFPTYQAGIPMSKLTIITDRALELAEQAGAGLRHAGRQAGSGLRQAGSGLRHAGYGAEHWIKTGAALGAARAGTRAATTVVRRNPVAVAAAAAVVGAGVLA